MAKLRSSRTRALPAADLDLWARYLRLVKPLPGVRVPVVTDVAIPERLLPPRMPQIDSAPRPSTPARLRAPITIGAAPPGLDRATWTRFRAGRMAPEQKLDLHGMTRAAAHGAVIALIGSAASRGLRCVEIVTGHGQRAGGEGVLRREVPFWLNDAPLRPLILAVCHPHAANQGALLVLLRRNRA